MTGCRDFDDARGSRRSSVPRNPSAQRRNPTYSQRTRLSLGPAATRAYAPGRKTPGRRSKSREPEASSRETRRDSHSHSPVELPFRAASASLAIMTDDRGDPFGDKGVGPFADFCSRELRVTGYAVLEAFKLRAVEPIAPDCTTEIRQGIAVDRRSLRKTRMVRPGLVHT